MIDKTVKLRQGKSAEITSSRRRATMVEVAHEAGVSQTTVSLVLNEVEGARFSVETRNRVRQAAQRLSYQPTRRRVTASELTQEAIAFIVDEISTDPWMALALDGIREKAWERGVTVTVTVTGGDPVVEQAIISRLLPDKYVGVIYGTINTRRIEAASVPRDFPAVLLNCYVADHQMPSVLPAEVLGGYIATQHLISVGHRRIGYINGEPGMDASRDRLRGYRRALAEADIAFDPELVRNGNWEPSTGYEHARVLMAQKDPATAIFCANDLMAFGCYDALKELGLTIPGDVAVIGYDDRDIAAFMRPPLTTVLLPHFEMGVEAVDWLFDNASRGPSRLNRIKVEGKLVQRASVI